MLEKSLTTPRGRPVTVQVSTRLALTDYNRLLEKTQREKVSLAKFLNRVLVAALDGHAEVQSDPGK